jgi:4-amino-4-deoxy-L-arabinose transferase-like glycosyltransferase
MPATGHDVHFLKGHPYNAPMSTELKEKNHEAPTRSVPQWRAPLVKLLLALAAVFIWRRFFIGYVNLIPDECSYWAWSRRLDWSYFDNSGMAAYLIRLSTTIWGESSPFSVRFPFLILSGLTTWLVYLVSKDLFGSKSRALIAATAFNLTPAALLGGALAMHDNALTFFWMLVLWAAVRFVKTEDGRWFYLMGPAAGLCMQSKYTGVLAVLSIFLFLLWSRPHRGRLLTKEPWIGAFLAFLFTVPILWWNMAHDWASLYHILFIGTGSPSITRRITDGLGYHAAQFLLVSPLFYVALVTACLSSAARNLFKPDPARALLLSFAFPLLLFGLLAFKGHVEANWAFMGYLSAGILAVEVLFREKGDAPRLVDRFGARYYRWAVVVAVVPVVLMILHAWIGLLPASLEKKLGKDDRIIWETRGWAGLGRHVAGLLADGDVIAADSYQLCALLEFNVPGRPKVRYLAPWRRPTQFDVWDPSFDDLAGKSILYVSSQPLEPSSNVLTTIFENFEKVEPLAPYKVMYHGSSIREVYVCRGRNFNPFKPRRLGPRSLFYRE